MNMTNHHKWSLDMVVRAYIGLRLSIWLPIYVSDDVQLYCVGDEYSSAQIWFSMYDSLADLILLGEKNQIINN